MERIKNGLNILIQGELEAVETYKKFGEVAKKEGFNNISKLFIALSKAEEVHIKNHCNAINIDIPTVQINVEFGSTLENLEKSYLGERMESKKLYPKIIKSIKTLLKTEEGKVANLSMTWAREVEKEHSKLLKLAIKSAKNGKDLPFDDIYFCRVCGHVEYRPFKKDVCPVCGHDVSFFNKIGEV